MTTSSRRTLSLLVTVAVFLLLPAEFGGADDLSGASTHVRLKLHTQIRMQVKSFWEDPLMF